LLHFNSKNKKQNEGKEFHYSFVIIILIYISIYSNIKFIKWYWKIKLRWVRKV